MLISKRDIKYKILILLILLVIPSIFALCEDNQIDINSASAEELDELYGIGPAKAGAIIDARPFDSVDDLIGVVGIGEITLEKIKNQGLACVEEADSEEEELPPEEELEEEDEEKEDETAEEKTPKKTTDKTPPVIEEVKKPVYEKKEVIKLNAQTIKTQKDNQNVDKNKYMVWGFVGFCILMGSLFLLRKNKYKNEFG